LTESTLRDQLQQSLGTAYTIQRELGGGGMSRVFVARDETLGRDVVIKVLPRELAAEMSVERFAREIKLAAALQHPHVLPVLSAGATDRLPYYTMPFVRGESLRAAMDSRTISQDDALGILMDVARALRYAHGEGVVHRDIKPENILLSSGSAVVVDFGIAKALSASRTEAPGGTLTLVGTSVGTPAYMSPEQAAADPNIDHRSDIYAWGVVAYELLAGRHPFSGKTTPQQFLAAHLSETPPPLRNVAPEVPAEIARIIMRTLEKEPGKRPQSADEILQQAGSATSRSGEVRAQRPQRWMWPIVAIAAIAIIASGLFLWNGRRGVDAGDQIMLAVLPFENQGPAEQEYFVDGLTDAVNGKLASLSGVSVIDRRSTLPYKKTSKPVKQIGSELGVQYVLGGVVRWAKGTAGWRAQVMPTLVSTRDATTKWAGDPVVVSSDDPFTAQTEIASRVADALQIALGSDERRDLASRPTQNTAAYDAYLRGRSILDRSYRVSPSVRDVDQAIAELRRAVSLDAKFAIAWATLSGALSTRGYLVPGDSMSIREATETAIKAERLDPRDPLVIAVRSNVLYREGNRDGARKLITDALKSGITHPYLLVGHAWDLYDLKQTDSANAAMARAVRMNPRDLDMHLNAAALAEQQKDWNTAMNAARTTTSIDPTDERGWAGLARIARNRGDTAGIRKTLEEAFSYIPAPSNLLLVSMVYGGHDLGMRFVKMTPEQLRIETIMDSVSTYYDNKADFFLNERDAERVAIYADSIIGKLERRNISGPVEPRLRLYLAHAYALTGRAEDARKELERARVAARAWKNLDPEGNIDLDQRIVASILARTGDYTGAVQELRKFARRTAWTPGGLMLEPKLVAFRGNSLFEAFAREK
jgi:eukaryotic-like serine/threonine-protein kinase